MSKDRKVVGGIVVGVVVLVLAVVVGLQLLRPAGEQLDKLTLSLNTWVGFGPFWLAEDRGYFADEGLDVEILTIDDTAARKAAMVRGDIDLLGDTVDLLVLERDEGVPAVAVSELDISNGADGILAIDSIQRVEDLKGTSIAVQKNFVSEAFLNYVLEAHGLAPTDVTTIDMEAGAAGAAFVSGDVDVAVTYEPWLSKAKERRGGTVLLSSADVPGVLVDVLTVRERYLSEHRDEVVRFLRAWFRAVETVTTDPTGSYAQMAPHYNLSEAEFGEIASGVTWTSVADSAAYLTGQGEGTLRSVAATFEALFLRTGQIKGKVNLDEAVDATLITELVGS